MKAIQHRQRLEITLDLFKGCEHSCAGCHVDKELGGHLSDVPVILTLMNELVAAGYVAFDLGIGPTDVMSSTNANEVLADKTVREMIQLFHQTTLNAAFLDKGIDNYIALCKVVDECAPDKPIRFLIPAAPASFKNPKFGELIVDKLNLIKETLSDAFLNEAGFVINCTADTIAENFHSYMNSSFAIDFPVDKDDILNIPYGRGNRRDIVIGDAIKYVSHRISGFYKTLNGTDERRRNPDLCFHTGTMMNLLYSDGKLYWVPFLKDDCVFIDTAFEVPRPWTMENLLTVRTEASNRSIEYLKDTPCMSCTYLSSCAEKGITSIMEKMSIKECLVGL